MKGVYGKIDSGQRDERMSFCRFFMMKTSDKPEIATKAGVVRFL